MAFAIRKRYVLVLLALCSITPAQQPQAPGTGLEAQKPTEPVTLFQNVRIFDGRSNALTGPSNVLVHGNTIEKISTAAIPTEPGAGTTIIDGGGRVLMPGLIDAHWHAYM